MKLNNTTIKFTKGDITDLQVDAIINPANGQLIMDNGLAGVIKQKGGLVIEDEAKEKAPLKNGEAIWTNAGELQANYIIHAVTVDDSYQTNEDLLRQSMSSAFRCAKELGVHSIAVPALGCGVGGFSKDDAAKIIAQEVLAVSRISDFSVSEIVFCLFDEETFVVFKEQVPSYLNYVQSKLNGGPYSTVDIIIELPEGIILIERFNPPFGWALPGGFLDYGESLETAARREAKEETNLDLGDLRQFHTYSEPNRDPRFHTVCTVFIATGRGTPQFGDDAKGLKIVKYDELLNLQYAFDHNKIIKDYLTLNGVRRR